MSKLSLVESARQLLTEAVKPKFMTVGELVDQLSKYDRSTTIDGETTSTIPYGSVKVREITKKTIVISVGASSRGPSNGW